MAKKLYPKGTKGSRLVNFGPDSSGETVFIQTDGLRRKISRFMKDRLGDSDLCLDETQALTIQNGLNDLVDSMSSVDDDSDLFDLKLQSAAEEVLATWVPLARLQCRDCLNTDCKARDPEFPVGMVKENKGVE